MTKTREGLAWLESLASQYELAALRIRALAREIGETERMMDRVDIGAAGREAVGDGGDNIVGVAEAIRIVLRKETEPVTVRHIADAFKAQRIPLKTQSSDVIKLLYVTLARMEKVGDIERRGTGRWAICRNAKETAAR